VEAAFLASIVLGAQAILAMTTGATGWTTR
jgi:hypothetical protein